MGHDQRICSPQSKPKFFEVKMGPFQVREIFEISRVQADVVVEEALEAQIIKLSVPGTLQLFDGDRACSRDAGHGKCRSEHGEQDGKQSEASQPMVGFHMFLL